MIKLAFAFFAKSGDVSSDGLFYILGGGFDKLTIPDVPTKIPLLCLMVNELFSEDEWEKEHRFRLGVTGPSDIKLPLTIDFPFRVSPPQEQGAERLAEFNTLLNFGGVDIVAAGSYDFLVTVDDILLCKLPLRFVVANPTGGSSS